MSKISEKGFGDGKSGKEYNNPHETGVLDRTFMAITDILVPGANTLSDSDKAEKEYRDSYNAGVAERKSGK
jgi:hypothetical protein